MKKKEDNPRVASNRRAHHYYELSERMEAGLELKGTEVKSLRGHQCNLQDGFARFDKGELFLHGVHISPFEQGNINNHEPTRPRKLLLHKSQLKRLFGLLTQKGLTLVPLSVYFTRGIAKCEIAIAKTKKAPDRRDDIKKRIAQREMDRAVKQRLK
ncbi:MAG: SsrA-binding protein SmpB [Candidatus Omnitrophica bacterium]|nr:SsrA-binding protein SmpB [Candidatus Omnitrophota bacterium]